MSSTPLAPSRALTTAGAATAAIAAAVAFGAGPAWAHVHVDADDDAAPGSSAVLAFQVPGESETGALTTQFSVTLPNVASARAEAIPGWTTRLDRDAASGTVRSITWTAAPTVGISSDQFGLFRASVMLPDQASVTLPATQTYSDGTVVKWDQAPLPDGAEPEHPAPVLTLGGSAPEHQMAPMTTPSVAAAPAPTAAEPTAPADDTARWLAGAALVVAALAVAAALVRGRRT
jgi:uncharacterized protein YcnI